MRYTIITIFWLGCWITAQAQRDAVWVFSDSSGINFINPNNPQVISSNCRGTIGENNACISSDQGDLLMYTSEDSTYWSYLNLRNMAGGIIPNGDSILCHNSLTQGTLFLPKPESNNLIYFFYIEGNPDYGKLDYAVIDLSMNGGLGGCTSKNNI